MSLDKILFAEYLAPLDIDQGKDKSDMEKGNLAPSGLQTPLS